MPQNIKFGTKMEGGIYVGQVGGNGLVVSPNTYESELRWRIMHLDGAVTYPAKRIVGELEVNGHLGWTLPTRQELEYLLSPRLFDSLSPTLHNPAYPAIPR